MKIHIIGAGAIGGMAGAYMAMGGEDVTFVDQWAEHATALRERGLEIDGVRGRHHLDVRALSPDELHEPIELAFVAVKSHHTESAGRLIQPLLTPDATVVSLQNGFNAEKLAGIVGGDRVLGTVPDYTAALVAPGRLEFTVEGPIYLGELDGSVRERTRTVERLLSMLTTTQVTPNIVGRIWTKQCYMSWIVMTALLDASFNEVMESMRNRMLGVAVVREAIAVADGAGIVLEEDAYFQSDLLRDRSRTARQEQAHRIQVLMDHFARRSAARAEESYRYVKKGSGMWWDIVYRHRPSETRWITGAIVERGEALGVPTPLNTAMADMIYEVEEGRRALGWSNLDELALLAVRLGEPLSLETEWDAARGAETGIA